MASVTSSLLVRSYPSLGTELAAKRQKLGFCCKRADGRRSGGSSRSRHPNCAVSIWQVLCAATAPTLSSDLGSFNMSAKRTPRAASGEAGETSRRSNAAVALADDTNGTEARANGYAGHNGHSQPEIRALLHGLQAMRDGDFSVRLPGDWTGLEGK